MNNIFVATEFSARVHRLTPFNVPGLLKLLDRRPDSVLSLFVDRGQACDRVIPAVRQRQYLRKQTFGSQTKLTVPEVVV